MPWGSQSPQGGKGPEEGAEQALAWVLVGVPLSGVMDTIL